MSYTYRFRYTLFGILFGLLFPVISSLLWLYQNQLPLTFTNLVLVQVNNPLQWIINSAPLFLGLFAYFVGVRQDHVNQLNLDLEASLAERDKLLEQLATAKLELENIVDKQVLQLKAAAVVAREAATNRDLLDLLSDTVDLISEQFGFYHAGIFMIDDSGEYAILQAASSNGGKRMLERHHKLKVGEVGIVGYVAGRGEARLALDVGTDVVFFNNPDLPQTRSEVALPLSARGEVIGVLDIQSTQANAFSQEDVAILQTLADQIALAIDNTRLLAESQQALLELYHLYEIQVGQAWHELLSHNKYAYKFDPYNTWSVDQQTPLIVTDEADPYTLNIPIVLRDLTIGSLKLQRDADQGDWSSDERELLEAMLNQVALRIENARLMEATQILAARERLTSQISARMWSSADIDTILRTALEELGQHLRVSEASIELEAIGFYEN